LKESSDGETLIAVSIMVPDLWSSKRSMYSYLWKSISQLRSVTCRMGSHSVTFHPTQANTPPLPQPDRLVLSRGESTTSTFRFYPGNMNRDWLEERSIGLLFWSPLNWTSATPANLVLILDFNPRVLYYLAYYSLKIINSLRLLYRCCQFLFTS